MVVQIGIAGVDHADQDLRDVDVPRPGCVHQVVEQRESDGNKDTSEEQDEGQEQVGIGENANVEIAQEKEDDQHEGKRYPSLIPLAAGRENIMSGANELDQAIDICHHDRRPKIMRSWMMIAMFQSPNTLKTYNSLRRLQPTH